VKRPGRAVTWFVVDLVALLSRAAASWPLPRQFSHRRRRLRTNKLSTMNLLTYTRCWNITFRLVVCVRPNLICCLYLVSVHVSVAAPTIWNTRPLDIRSSPSLCCFCCRLKTFFYNLAFTMLLTNCTHISTLPVNSRWYSLRRKPISELRSVTCHTGSHSVTCHPTQVNAPRHNPSHAGWYLIYLSQRDGRPSWADVGVGYILRWFTCPQTVSHPGTNHLIATRPGVEPTTSRSQIQRPSRYTTK